MTHVQLRPIGKSGAGHDLLIDGTPVTTVLHDGFKIETDSSPRFLVTMKFYADTLDVDLPDAALIALRSSEADCA